ncbi:uncharacterized protein LOC107371700 [Tetranychus urticae]|uniref:Aldehyde dehydrogenase domain-containing protein n=1 Tax=Tetranychus urticae TaxID=32264 RepID=T1JVV6_TETUR|nr:uncharacterized protein LOC107371700 [Tetranychus urticae]XP_025018505.1 uncharacterized protein LOC107371700 [Tetranychus urticae]
MHFGSNMMLSFNSTKLVSKLYELSYFGSSIARKLPQGNLSTFNCRCFATVSPTSSFLLDKAFINGKWVEPSAGGKFPVTNPATGDVLGFAPECTEKDALSAIAAANNAFQDWKNTSAKLRSSLIRKLYELQLKNLNSLAELISLEMGKPLRESKGEINYGASFFEWFSEETKRITGQVFPSPFPNSMTLYVREPIGPVGIITPWNFPNAMITRKLAAVLACGCTAVIRPAEDTPFSALALAKLVEEAGFPPGVVNVIPSSRDQASAIGSILSTSPEIAAISFTGSTNVGKILLSSSASTVKRVCLELGGNAPFIVFDSADIDAAVQGCIASKFRNTGQTCVSANRIFVQSGVHDKFVNALATEMAKSLKVGDPLDMSTTVGPLVNSKGLEKVKVHVEDALSKGGKLIVGGKHLHGNFFEPTLISNISENMKLCSEETFGPLAAIHPFETESQVIAAANSCRAGLAGYFYSSSIDQIWRVSKALQVGMVGVNAGIISCCEAPFGGVKESGLGREGSHLGIDEFTNVKYICLGSLN